MCDKIRKICQGVLVYLFQATLEGWGPACVVRSQILRRPGTVMNNLSRVGSPIPGPSFKSLQSSYFILVLFQDLGAKCNVHPSWEMDVCEST